MNYVAILHASLDYTVPPSGAPAVAAARVGSTLVAPGG